MELSGHSKSIKYTLSRGGNKILVPKKICPQLYQQIDIQHNAILPQWNYTIRPSLTACANPN